MLEFADHLVHRYEGKRCLVSGTGFSLNTVSTDDLLNFDGITIGVNTSFLKFIPDFYICNDLHPNIIFDVKNKEGYWYSTISSFCDPTKKDGRIYPFSNSSAIRAISIAYQFGCTEIYLIGIDACLGKGGEAYFTNTGEIDAQKYEHKVLSRMPEQFELYFKIIQKEGIKIFDLSDRGQLKGISKTTLKEIK